MTLLSPIPHMTLDYGKFVVCTYTLKFWGASGGDNLFCKSGGKASCKGGGGDDLKNSRATWP